jgi:tetratricopeptide (TPR) repeat protein
VKIFQVLFFILFSVTTALSQTKPEPKQEAPSQMSLYNRLEQQEEKRKALEQEVKENPNSAEAHYKLGNAYLAKLTEGKKALEEFQQAISLKPNYPEAFVGLGNAYFHVEMESKKGFSFQKAREAYRQAILLKPDYAEAYNALGSSYLIPNEGDNIGTFKEAADAFSEAIRIKPDYVEAYSGLGLAYAFLGRHEESIEALLKVKSLKPDDKFWSGAVSNTALRGLYTKQGNYEEAIKINQEEIQANPDSPLPYFTLGDLYFNVGRYDDAISEYKKGINIKPKNDSFMPDIARSYSDSQRLASLYVKMGRYEDAIAPCKEAIRKNPRNEEAYGILTEVYLKLNRNKEAIETSRQVVQVKPERADLIYELGSTYLATGDKQAALAQVKILSSLAQKAKDSDEKSRFERYVRKLLDEINK